MTRRLVAALVVGFSGAILVLLIGTGLGWWSEGNTQQASARRLDVRTSLAPAQSFFGDTLVAEVDVDLDTGAISPGQVRVAPNFTPYAETGVPVVTQRRSGRSTTARFRYRIQCLSQECLPGAGPFSLRLPPVVVSARDGERSRSVTAAWPRALVASRLSSSDLSRARFHRPATLLQPTYPASPSAVADLLTAVAGALALLAAAVLGVETVRLYDRRRRRPRLTPLERALQMTRESARRPSPADRRKALSLLSQTLADDGASKLAGAASVAAWSDSPPSPETVLQVADDVETAGSDPR